MGKLFIICIVVGFHYGIYNVTSNEMPRKTSVVENTVELPCTRKSSTKPLFRYIWTKGKTKIMPRDTVNNPVSSKRYTVLTNESVANLQIPEVHFTDAGMYSCIIYYESGGGEESSMYLQVQGHPTILEAATQYKEGDNVSLTCCLSLDTGSSNQTSLDWHTGGTYMTEQTSNIVETNKSVTTNCSNVHFVAGRQFNNETITCSLQARDSPQASMDLDILYSPSVILKSSDASFEDTTSFEEGEEVSITCTIDGNPRPNASLFKYTDDDWTTLHVVPSINYINSWTANWIFSLGNVTRRDMGQYRCASWNEIDRKEMSEIGYINILYPPDVNVTSSKGNSIKEDDRLFIDCITDSNPTPIVTLQKIVHSDTWATLLMHPIHKKMATLKSTWRFNFTKLDEDNQGTYRCCAFNEISDADCVLSDTIVIKYERKVGQRGFALFLICPSVIGLSVLCVVCVKKLRRKRLSGEFSIAMRYRRYMFSRSLRVNHNSADTVSSSFRGDIPCKSQLQLKNSHNDTMYHDIAKKDNELSTPTNRPNLYGNDEESDDSSFDDFPEYMGNTDSQQPDVDSTGYSKVMKSDICEDTYMTAFGYV